MKWEELTATEFEEAKKVTKGVAIIPIGCLEKHGHHMPLGTDIFIAKELAEQASNIEPALVVPPAPYGIISEAAHRAGCLSISSKLQYKILEELCDELARNGYSKIMILGGHGGATNFLNYFAQSRLEKYHPYVVYVYSAHFKSEQQMQEFLAINGPLKGSGHADVMETSEIMYSHPETVHLERIIKEETQPRLITEYLAENGLFTAINWYGNHPEHISGDPSDATAEKGKFLTQMYVKNVAHAIKLIKEDDKSMALQEEFYQMTKNPQK